MRNAINNLQATCSGQGAVSGDNVFKVVDQPHPLVAKRILDAAAARDIKTACYYIQGFFFDPLCFFPLVFGHTGLHTSGYSASDIITTVFRVCRDMKLEDARKLLFLKV